MLGRRSAIAAILGGVASGPAAIKAAAEAVAKGPGEVRAMPDVDDPWLEPTEQSVLERLHYRLRDHLEGMAHREEHRLLGGNNLPAKYHVPKSWSYAFRERAYGEDLAAAEQRRREINRALQRMGTKALIRAAKEAGIDVRGMVEDMAGPNRPTLGNKLRSTTPF